MLLCHLPRPREPPLDFAELMINLAPHAVAIEVPVLEGEHDLGVGYVRSWRVQGECVGLQEEEDPLALVRNVDSETRSRQLDVAVPVTD